MTIRLVAADTPRWRPVGSKVISCTSPSSPKATMKSLLRPLVAIALAVWLALPLFGSDGGDNAGGTGIWILPRATFLASGMSMATPRATKDLLSLGQDVVMEVSSECGACSATFFDEVSGQPVALQASGGLVRLPAALLQALAGAAGTKAHIVITDANQLGYLLTIDRREDGSLVLKVQ